MKRLKLLVTGITGLLGSYLKEYLNQQRYEVIGVSKNSDLANINVDLSNKEETFKILSLYKPDAIINLAALTDVDACERDPHKAYLNNCLIPKNLSDWIYISQSNTHLIHFSTDQVYGTDLIYSSESDIYISNIYGLTKLAGEYSLNNTRSTVIRTNFLGKSLVQGRESLSDWAIKMAEEGKHMNLFQDVLFSPLSMTSLVQLIERIINNPLAGTFNLGSQGVLSKADMIVAILKGLGLPKEKISFINSNEIDFLAKRPLNMGMDCSLFERRYNIKLPSIDDEIKKILEEYKNEK